MRSWSAPTILYYGLQAQAPCPNCTKPTLLVKSHSAPFFRGTSVTNKDTLRQPTIIFWFTDPPSTQARFPGSCVLVSILLFLNFHPFHLWSLTTTNISRREEYTTPSSGVIAFAAPRETPQSTPRVRTKQATLLPRLLPTSIRRPWIFAFCVCWHQHHAQVCSPTRLHSEAPCPVIATAASESDFSPFSVSNS